MAIGKRFAALGDGHKVPLEEQELRSFEAKGEKSIEQGAAHSS